ncbi:predicted protein [Lichtheimia corymbifera JMRC:FSU:9682]|uniref:Uncharacterized protein n=1 Tax=Lichtheimia corymbifera JMRC:FSU:9682 TaxID=1263082 RepID=A0A068RFS8_9FUNG|nr:predicted protein [Lichtheimia corymbifera JMRC:FSU:9682]
MPVSLNFTMKRGVFNRTKLLVGVERTLCGTFTIVVADLRFTQCRSWVDLLNSFSTRLVVTLGESEIGHDDRETCTQGALDPAAQLVRLKTPRFIVEFRDIGTFMFLHML